MPGSKEVDNKVWNKLKKLIEQGELPNIEKKEFINWFNNDKINSSLNGKWNRIQRDKSKNGKKRYKVQWKNSFEFKVWYCRKYYEQKRLCKYCGIPQEYLLKIYDRQDGFRKGTRGRTLEIDRPDNGNYDDNCVLACYPCNNAKSDVFDGTVFQEIADAIKKEWAQMAKKKLLLDEIIKKYPLLKEDVIIKEFLKSK